MKMMQGKAHILFLSFALPQSIQSTMSSELSVVILHFSMVRHFIVFRKEVNKYCYAADFFSFLLAEKTRLKNREMKPKRDDRKVKDEE